MLLQLVRCVMTPFYIYTIFVKAYYNLLRHPVRQVLNRYPDLCFVILHTQTLERNIGIEIGIERD